MSRAGRGASGAPSTGLYHALHANTPVHQYVLSRAPFTRHVALMNSITKERLQYSHLPSKVFFLAKLLRRHCDLRSHDRVLILLKPKLSLGLHFLLFLAVSACGAASSFLNAREMTDEDLQQCIDVLRPRLVVFSPDVVRKHTSVISAIGAVKPGEESPKAASSLPLLDFDAVSPSDDAKPGQADMRSPERFSLGRKGEISEAGKVSQDSDAIASRVKSIGGTGGARALFPEAEPPKPPVHDDSAEKKRLDSPPVILLTTRKGVRVRRTFPDYVEMDTVLDGSREALRRREQKESEAKASAAKAAEAGVAGESEAEGEGEVAEKPDPAADVALSAAEEEGEQQTSAAAKEGILLDIPGPPTSALPPVPGPTETKPRDLPPIPMKVQQKSQTKPGVVPDPLSIPPRDLPKRRLYYIEDFLKTTKADVDVTSGISLLFEHDDVVLLPYTNKKKCIRLTHGNIVSNLLQLEEANEIPALSSKTRARPSQVVLLCHPYHHIFTFIFLLHAITRGATVVTFPRFTVENFLVCVAKHRVTRAYLSLPHVLQLYAKFRRRGAFAGLDFSSLKVIVVVGPARVSRIIQRELQVRMKVRVKQMYGYSETLILSIEADRTSRESDISKISQDRQGGLSIPKCGAVGKLLPHTHCRIVDRKLHSKRVPNNTIGEILIKDAPQVMRGYLHEPGYLSYFSGDMGMFDHRNVLFVIDRKANILSVAGNEFFETELRDILLEHNDVHDATVVNDHGLVKAFVVKESESPINQKDLIEYVIRRLKESESFKIINQVFFMDAIPRNSIGNIRKEKLKAKSPLFS